MFTNNEDNVMCSTELQTLADYPTITIRPIQLADEIGMSVRQDPEDAHQVIYSLAL